MLRIDWLTWTVLSNSMHSPPLEQTWNISKFGCKAAFPFSHCGDVQLLTSFDPLKTENFPLGQEMQVTPDEAPSSAEYFPGLQSEHTEFWVPPKVVEYLPAGQRKHELIPILSLNLPASHVRQKLAPVLFEYFPTPHKVQRHLEPSPQRPPEGERERERGGERREGRGEHQSGPQTHRSRYNHAAPWREGWAGGEGGGPKTPEGGTAKVRRDVDVHAHGSVATPAAASEFLQTP